MKYVFSLALLLLFTGCSLKMDTHNYSDGTSAYDDEMNGLMVKILLDDGLCIKNGSTLKKGNATILLTLTKWCKLINAEKYVNNQFVESVMNEETARFVEKYITDRKKIENQINLFKPRKKRISTTTYYYGKYENTLAKSSKCFKKGGASLRTEDNITWLGEFKYYINSKLNVYQISGTLSNGVIKSNKKNLNFNAILENEEITGNYNTVDCRGTFKLSLVK